MQNINWEMMTQFIFPEEIGIVEEVISVDIKPRWQQIDSDNSVRLVGIYHITAVARFNPKQLPVYSEGTLIEHLDFDGNDGYFEYALPLEVDLPREKVAVDHHPELFVENVSFFVYDGSNCTFKWEVKCTFKEPVEGALFTFNTYEPEFEQEPAQETVLESAPELMSEPVIESVPEPVLESVLEPEPEPELELVQETNQESVQDFQQVVYEDATNEAIESSSSVHLAIDINYGAVVLNDKSEEKVIEAINELEPVHSLESLTINKYFPTDTDDFFNNLTETYSLLNVSNKISRK